MIIKVCGMREKENIHQLLENAAPDLMGLIFYAQSPRFVEKQNGLPEFCKTLPVSKVGVFVNAPLEYILSKINDFALEFVQLHGDETVEFIRELKSASPIKVIKVFRIGEEVDWQELKSFEEDVDLFLFDTETHHFGGSGKQFDWSVLEQYPFQKGFLLSGGVDRESLDTINVLAIKLPQLMGVDINSKFEVRPGWKDVLQVSEFVKELRSRAI
jgi:phosphoribosylanthranilate isomerase